MKILFLFLLIVSTFLGGCDRNALDGLNLKINTEVKSDYDDDKNNQDNNDSQNETSDNNAHNNASESSSAVNDNKNNNATETTKKATMESANEPTTEKNANNVNGLEPDADQPMPFKEITQCSKAGITAKTNEIFYAENANVKSIDSKNEQQMKAWKKIYAQVEKECQN